MAHDAVHDLTPAYALDALDDREREAYEAHLATCDDCRAELASLQETTTSLAYAVPAPPPSDALRDRILEQARRERENVVPLRPRRVPYALATVAAVAATIAIALGIWNLALVDERNDLRALADPHARVVELPDRGALAGRLLVEPDGDARLVVDGAPTAPDKDYEIWVFDGETPRPAGVFDGGRRVVRLTRPVPRGASVAVTIERNGGVERPTTRPLFVVRA